MNGGTNRLPGLLSLSFPEFDGEAILHRLDLAGICMRFAFIDSMYKDKKPFIILDDPFVNMDTFSINNAHRLIEKLAKKYQILYFTCHNSRTMK
jgi:ABC-type lipopolysaccharide export system ATPase subunit